MTAVRMTARLLGTFEVEIDSRPLDRAAFERPSGLRLLKLLLATPEHRVRREAAAELLWPEADPERSAGNLRKAIHFARRGLAALADEDAIVIGDGEWVRFAPELALNVDADRLTAALDRLDGAGSPGALDDPAAAGRVQPRPPVDHLQVVAELGGNELLPEDPYEEWLVPIRERLRQRVLAGALAGVADARRRGDAGLAMRLVDRVLALDPADEAAHRVLIEMHLEAGRLHAARRQLLACRRALADAYGIEPSKELIALVDIAAADRTRAVADLNPEPEIIGRRLELDRAEAALDVVAAGRPAAILLRGAAGIGKSRMLRELVRLGAAGGWRILELRGVELAPDSAFASLGASLSNAIEPQGLDGWAEPARSALLTIAPALQDRIGTAPGGEAGPGTGSVVEFATDAGLRSGAVEALRRLAVERPLVLAIDDVQWLDRATVSLLQAVIAGQDSPILVAATLRDELMAPDPELDELIGDLRRAGGAEIRLAPLGRREIELLLERELDGGHLAEGLAGVVADQAGGTPLYALQLLRGARESGAISLRDGRWRMVGPASSLPVPESVRRAIEERTARLVPAIRSILAVAAELGDEVSYDVLVAAAAADPETVLDALDEGLRLDLLVERGARYRFGHPLYRAALRANVPRRSRAALHRRIAEALASQVDPADERAIGAAITAGVDALGVAAHAAEAVELGAPDALPLAIGFGFAAGARQAVLFDYDGAAATLRRALGLWYRLAEEDRNTFPASAAQHRLGVALKALAEHAAAGEAFRAEIATATTDMERARGYAALSWLPYEHGRFERSADILREGISSVEDPLARAFLESGLGWIRGRQGDWNTAYELLEPVVAVMERGAPADLLARALDRFAVAIRDRGRPERSIPVFRRALGLCREAGNVHEEAIVRMHLASALRDGGDLIAARDEVGKTIELTRLTGDRYIDSVAHWILAEVEDSAGDRELAAAARRTEIEILVSIGGNPQNQAMAHAHLAHLAARDGDGDTAAAEAEAARSLAAHAGLDYLPGLVERAITATDWFRVAHRHVEDGDHDVLSGSHGR